MAAISQVRITHGIRTAVFNSLGFRTGGIHRDAHTGTAVSLGIDQVDGGLISGYQSAVRIGAGSTKSQESRRMLQKAPDIIPAKAAGKSIAFGIIKEVLPIFPDTLMDMHAGAIILEEGLGHESGRITIL